SIHPILCCYHIHSYSSACSSSISSSNSSCIKANISPVIAFLIHLNPGAISSTIFSHSIVHHSGIVLFSLSIVIIVNSSRSRNSNCCTKSHSC
ncbi:hypothetical protein F3D69_31615, partial [Bacteroides ovatus]